MSPSDSNPAALSGPARQAVFLVDDHPLVRDGLAKLIAQEPDLMVCGYAEEAEQAFDAIVRLRPQAAIIDVTLRGESGLNLIKRLQQIARPPAILVLSMHDETAYADRAIRAGALGYVMKCESAGKVLAGIRQVLAGRLFVSQAVLDAAAQRYLSAGLEAHQSPVARLSDRELEVFRRIGLGQENRQIAEALKLSLKTVQTHCAHIKEKLGLASATLLMREAVRWVEEQGFQ